MLRNTLTVKGNVVIHHVPACESLRAASCPSQGRTQNQGETWFPDK